MPGIDSLSGRDDFEDDILSDDGDNDDEDESM